MTLPFPPYNPSAPIPNGIFSSIDNYFLQGATGPLIVGNGIQIDVDGTISATGTGSSGTVTSVTAGTGLAGGTITTSGTISLASSGVTPGTYTYPAFYVDTYGRITSISSGNPVVSVSANAPLSITGSPVSPVLSVGLASTTGYGVTRLTNSTVSTVTNEALTAAGANSLQIQIDALAKSLGGLNLAGTFDASTGNVVTATAAGNLVGITASNPLPLPSGTVESYYVIVTTGTTLYTPPGSPPISNINVGDYILAVDGVWNILRIGPGVGPYATTTSAGSVRLATLSEVAAGVDPNAVITPMTGDATYLSKEVVTAPGQLLVGDSPSSLAALSLGNTGQVLIVDPATPYGIKWATLGGGGTPISCISFSSPLTSTSNPLTSGSANVSVTSASVSSSGVVRLATAPEAIAGTSSDLAITPVSGAAAYVRTNSFVTPGELTVGTGVGTYTALPPGSDGQILVACSTDSTGLCWINANPSPSNATPQTAGLVYGCQINSLTAFGLCAYSNPGPSVPISTTLVGYGAGRNISGVSATVAVGNLALGSAIDGSSNTVVGSDAFGDVSVTRGGDRNTALGSSAGFRSCFTSDNTFLGAFSGSNTVGGNNTFIGSCAGYCVTSGSSNVILVAGGNVGTNPSEDFTGDNVIVIGTNTGSPSSSTATKEVSIWAGGTIARFSEGSTGWSFISDVRAKEKIEDLDVGLDLIDKLQPRKFVWKESQKSSAGFIAQEVDEALKEVEYGESLSIINKDDLNHYLVSMEAMIPVLVNSIKELKSEIEELKKKVG